MLPTSDKLARAPSARRRILSRVCIAARALESDGRPGLQCYLGRMPLSGMEDAASLAATISSPQLISIALRHSFVLISNNEDQCLYSDFLPLQPTNPATIVRLLAPGGSAPGETRVKRLPRVLRGPTIQLTLRGCTTLIDLNAVEDCVRQFNASHWDHSLRLLTHDCTAYSEALMKHVLAVDMVTSHHSGSVTAVMHDD